MRSWKRKIYCFESFQAMPSRPSGEGSSEVNKVRSRKVNSVYVADIRRFQV